MKIIGLFVCLTAVIVTILANHDEQLSLLPSTSEIIRFTNDSHIVRCNIQNGMEVHWKSPKEEIVKEKKGRIHIEEKSADQVALVFEHISLADKGTWTCEEVGEGQAKVSFQLSVKQKISFMDNDTILTVKEGKNATIRCEVTGDPEPTVSWYFNGEPISFGTPKFKKLGDGLLIHRVQQNDTGEYTCKAFQISAELTDVKEHTVLLKIEHKPFWTHKHHAGLQYGYIGGTVNIICDSVAEPAANFTWFRNKKRMSPEKNTILSEPHVSTLQIEIKDSSVFDTYKCKASNNLGTIERTTILDQGTKPPAPTTLQLRGFNSNTFDVDVVSPRHPGPKLPMDVNGFRIEYMTDYEFKQVGGNWTYAKRRDFKDQDGATFLINNLEGNQTYLMRAATKNVAGLSDWTRVEKFTTLSNEPPSSSGHMQILSILEILLISILPYSRICQESFLNL